MGVLYKELSCEIIGAFYKVYNTLGYGFYENVYKNALYLELKDRGIGVDTEYNIDVNYKDRKVGNYQADLIVEKKIILELKATASFHPVYETQLLNYMAATNIELGYVLNFGIEAKYKRRIITNDRKNNSIQII